MSASCETCKFYDKIDFSNSGLCHRFPPTIIQDPKYKPYYAEFPRVYKIAWCGEYKELPVFDNTDQH